MKKVLYSMAIIAAMTACTKDLNENVLSSETDKTTATIVHSTKNAEPGEMVVKFNAVAEQALERVASRADATRTGVEGVDAILEAIGAISVEPVFVVTEKNAQAVHEAGLHLWYTLRFSEDADLESVANSLARVAEVNTVQYNVHVQKTFGTRPAVLLDEAKAMAQAAATRATAQHNDPYLSNQWHYINTGSSSVTSPSKAGADVNCEAAWRVCCGDPSIIVAIVDEGVMYSHEDIAANMWINTAEKNGTSNRDDDGNGYKDDIYGYNFVSSTGTISWNKSGDTGHGTHVGGTVAAVNNNGKGVCGIAGGSGKNDGVKLMTCQIFSGNSGATTANTAKAIQYAADNGAVVLQCSWGYNSALADESAGPGNDSAFNSYCSAEKAAIDYFIANAGSETGPIKGGVAIFAAGNESAAVPGYPSAYEPCVCVTAMAADYTPSSFTNYGPGADICAPGGDSDYAKSSNGTIVSTLPNGSSSTYGYMEGTSMACPHVSGVAALGLSYAAKLGKHFTANEFRSLLLSSVDDINQYLTGTKQYYYYYSNYGTKYPKTMDLTNSYKNKMGAGLTDAYRLLMAVEGTPCVTVPASQTVATAIDVTPFFGEGAASLKFKSATVPSADKSAVGMGACTFSGSKLYVLCTKPGAAKVTVTALVGGTSQNSSSQPIATEVTRTFSLIVREGGEAANGGWL